MAEVSPVVLDCGSHTIKAGFAGDDEPIARVLSVVGRRQGKETVMVGLDRKQVYVGAEARDRRAGLALRYPISKGVVTNWEDMTKLYEHVFHSVLKTPPEDVPVLVSEPCFNSKANREKLTQIFFEDFNVPAFYLSLQTTLALYATGHVTGTVLDVGEDTAVSAPTFSGYALPHAIEGANVAGRQITEYLHALLLKSRQVDESCDLDLVRDIKEKLCYVALEEDAPSEAKTFELPDGKTISVGSERSQAAELLFKPSLGDMAGPDLSSLVAESIRKCDADCQKDLFASIVLAGGTTLFPGLGPRLEAGIRARVPPSTKVCVTSSSKSSIHTWVGGSILASLSTYKGMWISQQEYEESGPQIVLRKCF